jgi:rare lipoprotein A
MAASRFAIVLVATVFAVGALTQNAAAGQNKTRTFSGLCAYDTTSGRLASDQPPNPNAFTAAHRTLPFGTRVRVTDPKTGRSVIVTINDRGPYGKGRVIDVSLSAARALGMIGRGIIFVRAEIL